MSDQLHPTHLEWAHGRGLARHDGVLIELRQCPLPRTWAEVHYTPGIQGEVREHASDARRDMTADEIRMAQRWLDHMAHACREACGQNH